MEAPVASPIPADARRSLLIYNLLFPFAFVAMLPSLLTRMIRRGNYQSKFGQRLGNYSAEDRERFAKGEWIWVHSISVGETILALKLVKAIHALEPRSNIVLSVTTSTGFGEAQPHVSDWLEVIYNPLDAPGIVERALQLVRPRRLIFIEAVWPNLLSATKSRGIPVTFLPRLSPRSESRFRRFRQLTGPIFRLVDWLAAGEPEDIARWKSLGVPEERVRVTGNPKFDGGGANPERAAKFRNFLSECGVPDNAPILLAGSTFDGEERILAEVYRELRGEFPDLFLILVPRHVERTDSILKELQPLNLRVARRTQKPQASAEVLIVDTTGELRDWYLLATVVFIGKSLTATGGQNPVEPVLAGKPVMFGPHMENFSPIVPKWLAANAAVQITDAGELRERAGGLLRDEALRTDLAKRARKIAEPHQGATARAIRVLMESSESL